MNRIYALVKYLCLTEPYNPNHLEYLATSKYYMTYKENVNFMRRITSFNHTSLLILPSFLLIKLIPNHLMPSSLSSWFSSDTNCAETRTFQLRLFAQDRLFKSRPVLVPFLPLPFFFFVPSSPPFSLPWHNLGNDVPSDLTIGSRTSVCLYHSTWNLVYFTLTQQWMKCPEVSFSFLSLPPPSTMFKTSPTS